MTVVFKKRNTKGEKMQKKEAINFLIDFNVRADSELASYSAKDLYRLIDLELQREARASTLIRLHRRLTTQRAREERKQLLANNTYWRVNPGRKSLSDDNGD